MTAALYHVDPGSLTATGPGTRLVLDGPEGHHAATVKRVEVGEEILLADASGLVALCSVAGVDKGTVEVEVRAVEDRTPHGARLVLVQALAKGGRDEQAVETATEYGVDGVIPWQAARCIVRLKGERADKMVGKWRSLVTAAAKQSRRATVPEVTPIVTTERLVDRVKDASATFVLHEDATDPLAGVAVPEDGDVLLVVGPEGGIAPDEVDALVAAGARPVRLGREVLRSSSAGPAALAVLSAASRWR